MTIHVAAETWQQFVNNPTFIMYSAVNVIKTEMFSFFGNEIDVILISRNSHWIPVWSCSKSSKLFDSPLLNFKLQDLSFETCSSSEFAILTTVIARYQFLARKKLNFLLYFVITIDHYLKVEHVCPLNLFVAYALSRRAGKWRSVDNKFFWQ